MRKANIIISIILFCFTAFFAYLTAKLPDRNLPNTLGGDFVPWTLIIILFSLSLLLFLNSVIDKKLKTQITITLKEVGGVLALVILILAYTRGMLYFGYLITTPIFIGIMMRLSGAKKLRDIILGSLLTTAGVYLLFSRLFEVVLPEGKFF
jgi:hypothetical protein